MPGSPEQVYTLSTRGKNVVLMMVDCAIPGFLPVIFEEKPELRETFGGWRFYPNCISFGNHTMVGALPIYGGYEYTPENINKRNTDPLLEKQREAYLLLPKLFVESGYETTVTDPPFDNYLETNMGVFRDHPEINAQNINGRWTSFWLRKHPEVTLLSISAILKRNLLYFSVFKAAPIFLRMYIYDRGDWLSTETGNGGMTKEFIDDYALFDLLPALTRIEDSETDTFAGIYEPLPHEPSLLQFPDYEIASPVTDSGSGAFSDDAYYHVNAAMFMMLARWIHFLKENNVYDNTRIILVSDHGRGNRASSSNIELPDGGRLQSYNALLMVKDFNAEGDFETDWSFMTNADTPLLAVRGIIENPVNPFTARKLAADKDGGATITTIGALSSRVHTRYLYKIRDDQWLHVTDNIFDPANWTRVLSLTDDR